SWLFATRQALHLALLLIGALVFAFLFSGRSKAQTFRPAAEAPAAWTAFAKTLQTRSEAALRADDEVARRLQTALEKLRVANPDQPPLKIAMRVWVAASGRVERVTFTALPDAAADADLRTLLSRVMVGAPPAGMLQPVHLRLSLEPRN